MANCEWLRLVAKFIVFDTRRSRSFGGSHVEVLNSGFGISNHEQMESESDIDQEKSIQTLVAKTGG